MGVVYKAQDIRLGRFVAVKFLQQDIAHDPKALSRFEREARAASGLNHANICTIHGVEEYNRQPVIVMELLEGQSLRQKIAWGPIAIDEILDLSIETASALEAAHNKGIIHRDIKPANIFVTAQGNAKVLDFGLAKAAPKLHEQTGLRSTAAMDDELTGAGIAMGTVSYMSPEQIRAEPLDARTDLFSLGVVIYQMATGKLPFSGPSQPLIFDAILNREPVSPVTLNPELPVDLERIVNKCLEKDRKLRYQHAAEIRADLLRLQRDRGSGKTRSIQAAPPKAVDARPRGSANRYWWIVVAAAAVVLAGAGYWAATSFHKTPADERVVSFYIDPPEGGHFARGTNVTGISLSPDGKTAAFTASAKGKSGLWVRPLDGTTPKLLPGTEGAGQPFWSPDSSSIAFFLDGKLQRIDPFGGSPEPICQTDSPRGGSWGDSGLIVFGRAGDGLYRVASTGGQATPLTTLNKDRAETFHYWPQLLPGGNFLYFVRSNKPENSGIYAASLDKPNAAVQLVSSDASGWFTPSPDGARNNRKGYLLWLRGGTLVAQPFDPGALKLSGEPRPVASPVARYGVSGQMTLSASVTGLLLYAPSYALNQLTWMDRAGNPTATIGEPLNIGPFALSHDGRRVAMAMPNSAGTDIWFMDTERGVTTRFTSRPGQSVGPVWSPDGRTLLFNSGPPFRMYRKDTSGAAPEQEFHGTPSTQFPEAWSPDGRFILYQDNGHTHDRGALWIYPEKPEDGQPRPWRQTSFAEDQAQFSPDGKWVAFRSDESGQDEVYIDTFPQPGKKVRISTGGGGFPQWGKEGREMFYVSPDHMLMSVELKIAPDSIQPSTPHSLFALGLHDGGLNPYIVSRDGRILVNRWIENKPPLTVIVNWPALLKKTVASQ